MAKKAARSGAKATSHTPVRMTRESGSAPQATRGVLVAVELGGEWPNVAFDGQQRRVLVQLEGEAPLAFAERVTSGLAALFERGVELHTLALACNERLDAAADEARRNLLGMSLGSMAHRRRGEVVLSAAPRSRARLGTYLEALAADSRREWQSAGLEVSVDCARETAAPMGATPPSAVSSRVA
jgi:hypothetical protein